MGFGTDLQGKVSHDALLRFHDTEIRLLENVKRCVSMRVESDRRYTVSLGGMIQQAHKLDTAEFSTMCNVFKAWDAFVKQSEEMVRQIKQNIEDLSSRTLEKLTLLIIDKKATRKFYVEERSRLEGEFTKIQDEVQKNKVDYSKIRDKLRPDQVKYEDLYSKGKAGSRFEDTKLKYVKNSVKLHKCHNEYVFSLRDVNMHQANYLSTNLPSLLDHHQATQELVVEQCKELFEDIHQLTDLSGPEFRRLSEIVSESIRNIKSDTEYQEFINTYKSDPITPQMFEFDSMLLDEYNGKLLADTIALDDLTHEMLVVKNAGFDDRLSELRKSLEEKQKSHTDLEETLTQIARESVTNVKNNNDYIVNKRAKLNLNKQITELETSISKYVALQEMVAKLLTDLGEETPPSGLELLDLTAPGADPLDSTIPPTQSKLWKKKLQNPFSRRISDQDKRVNYEPTEPHNGGVGTPGRSSGNDVMPIMHKKLEDEDWYHGVLPREEVQRLLQTDGDFLVRESKNKKTGEKQHVLSVYWQGYKHFIIQFGEGGWRFEGRAFPTIQLLVAFQHKSNEAVTNKSQAFLKKPIVREEWELRNDDVLLEMKIGSGNFGEVYKGVFKPKSMVVAVKTCRDTLSDDQRKKFLQEGRILKQYNHINIVRFIGIAAQRQPTMIVMEYVSGGSLHKFLQKKGNQQSTRQLCLMCENAANGMMYLEENSCIHRDLAARNCLVGDDNIIKISDFGMSREEEEYTVSEGMKQIPIKWTAPEALNFGKYTSLCDVWSYGILIWEVFAFGATPYSGMNNVVAREQIDQGFRMSSPDGTPEDVYQMMLHCWEAEPDKRPRFKEIFDEFQIIVSSY